MSARVTQIRNIQNENYQWYVFFLDDGWDDQLRQEVRNNIDRFGERLEEYGLAVHSFPGREENFARQVVGRYRLYLLGYPYENLPFPAIMVTNIIPSAEEREDDDGVVLLFSVGEEYIQPGDISNFLQELSNTLRREDSLEALTSRNDDLVERVWAWINRYFAIKPTLFGLVEINANNMIRDFFRLGR